MTSYFSSLLTTTTSRVASIRQNLLPSENDGDTEDDTHVCRVLRAYYTEKGRSFPAWLPPDPKAPPPVVVQPVYAQSSVGSRYGGLQNQPAGVSGGGLASLWDKQPAQQIQPQEQQSLRQGRGQGRVAAASGRNPFANQNSPQAPQAVQAQPLPSQKGGSYQQTMFGRNDSTPPGSSGGPAPMSSRQRLAAQFNNKPGPQRSQSYESSAPAAPLTSANSPWSNSGGGYDAGGYDAGGRYDGGSRNAGRQGLPSGPGAGRRGPGLPSGPRGPR
ncbi:hypothetical protein WAI453_004945 [Rhynchosporium graminicola]|uniref:Mso1 N-terminal domain-containing protein n=1 Tax=Rhynchosporium graminicola TaxID=2792576 RepID=A0A1E1L4T9_9HELO|nr:uncharacterized protein RCO7_08437 [Rhynchosporium commune]